MKISVFSFDANPAVEVPIYRLTKRRAQDEVDRRISDWIGPYEIQRRDPHDSRRVKNHPDFKNAWPVSKFSFLPNGQRLGIWTRQFRSSR
jgi:hypothetical protein